MNLKIDMFILIHGLILEFKIKKVIQCTKFIFLLDLREVINGNLKMEGTRHHTNS